MNGMKLCEDFYYEILKDKIKLNFPELKYAAGLIGYGSECYGYDDKISQDHDFTPLPCIFLKEEDYLVYKEKLESIIESIKEYRGYNITDKTIWNDKRRGVININDFVYSFIGCDKITDIDYYRNIPEYLLSSFTNGKIFEDEDDIITTIRDELSYYPDDIRLNKIATRCMIATREAVNFERCTKRKDVIASNQALSKFIEEAIELYFLIYKKYCPYYKWYARMLKDIDEKAYNNFEKLLDNEVSNNNKISIIDRICSNIIDLMEEKNIIVRVSDVLSYYGPVIQSRIDNDNIRNLGAWSD